MSHHRLTSRTTTFTTTHIYDAANQLTSTTDPNGATTGYTYDGVGNRTGVIDPLGVSSAVTFNGANLPTQTTHTVNGTLRDTTTASFDTRNDPQNQVTSWSGFTITSTTNYSGNDYMTGLNNSSAGIYTGSSWYGLTYYDNNLAYSVTSNFWNGGSSFYYDGANRIKCWKSSDQGGPEFWTYYPNGNLQYHYWGYNPITGCTQGDAWPYYTASREEYIYQGEELTRRENRGYGDLSTLNAVNTYSYDSAGDMTQDVKVDYTNGTTTTVSYQWTWQAGANRLTTITNSGGTTTFDYDQAGRISHRHTSLGYSDYIYEGNTDWILRETWHSSVSGAVFDLLRYQYANGRPNRVEEWSGPGDLSAVWGYNRYYLQGNWHGDVSTYTNADDSNGSTDMSLYPPWGNYQSGTKDYYRWNGMWGYQWYGQFGLYYVHGRWYNPDLARFLAPDEKGDYRYGSGDNPIDLVWKFAREVGEGAVYQVIKTNSDAGAILLSGELRDLRQEASARTEQNLPTTPAFQGGRLLGDAFTLAQGFGEFSAGPTIAGGGTVAACGVTGLETAGVGCLVGGAVSVGAGTAVLVHGLAVGELSLLNARNTAVSLMAGKSGSGPSGGGREALNDLLGRSTPGRSPRVREVTGTVTDAEAEFRRIAEPGSIAPHPDPDLAAAGGLRGTVPGGGRILFRPYSDSGPATIDLHDVPGLQENMEIKFK